MDERELVALLYRVDWTRLALTGTLRDGGAEQSLVLAPGRRYRVTSSNGSGVMGCDGERAWQWFTDLPPDTKVRFGESPELPAGELLAPVWLLLGYRLTVGAETTVAGRRGIAVTGVARTHPLRGLVGTMLLSWGMVRRPDRVTAVIDAEIGIVLRRELSSAAGDDSGADADADVMEFLSLEVGDSADPTEFTAPEGSFFGDGPSGGRASDRRPVDEVGLAALKMVGGLAAGGLGAALRYSPKRHPDPFVAATSEDPADAMPDDEPLPGWAMDGAADDGRAPVPDEVLDLLYRGGLAAGPIGAEMHQWSDNDVMAGALLRAVPESARRAGFGGVGFLVDTILADDRDAGRTMHAVYRVRVGGWDRYRVDRVRRVPPDPPRWLRGRRQDGDALTVACDGERTFTVLSDEVLVGPARVLDEGRHGELLQLLDGSWLLMYRLSGGEVIEVDGRPAYRVIATAGAGPVPGAPLSWLPAWWLPAVAVVDASSGRLLRLTRYRNGVAAMRVELRSLSDELSDDGAADFGFTPPEGLPVVEAVKERVDAKISAARGFLGSFLGGRLALPSLRGTPGGRRRFPAGIPLPGSGRRAAGGPSPFGRIRARPR